MRTPSLTSTPPTQADAVGMPAAQPGAPACDGRCPYEPPSVEPLGHWQVHTMDTFSVPVLP